MMRRLTGEIVMATAIMLGSCFLYVQTWHFPSVALKGDVGPGYWPAILLGGLIFLGFLLFEQIYREREKIAAFIEEKLPFPKRFWSALAVAVLYTFLMPYIGFMLSTLLYCLVQMWLLGLRPLKRLGMVAFGITALFLVLFPILLGVPMPRGVGIFRDITLLFY